jgi:N utilization substance protein B
MQALYQHNLTQSSWLELVEQFLTTNETPPYTDVDYFAHLIQGIFTRFNEIDQAMIPFLDRDIQELNPIELVILRLAFFELLYQPDVPQKVVVNEAVELAKSFGATEGYKYVNAVLDAFLKKHKH